MKSKKEPPFFVGYLDMPKALEKFYWPLTILMLLGSMLIGYGFASAQKSPIAASWDTSQSEKIQGLLQLNPYPVLHRIDPNDSSNVESILLVKQGKYSADSAAQPYHNKIVTVNGFPIRHGGWTMLEISKDEDIQPESSLSQQDVQRLTQATQPISLGTVALSGEVIDSKCYLGVMKPGEGLVHRACAEVCLLGGMPTMLVVRGTDKNRYGYILTSAENASVSIDYAKQAAENREVQGEMIQRGDLLYIRMQPTNSTADISAAASRVAG